MKNILQIIGVFLFLLALKVNAQNYSPIISGNTSLFLHEYNAIAALHIDSITSDSKGTAYHFLKTWQHGSDCIDHRQATWAGPKCIKNNNTHFFFNDNLDTIYFYPSKEVNTSWKFYNYANGDYIEALVTAKGIKTFLGLTDSVKTISLQRKDVNGNNLSNNMIGTSIEYSKYYGFIKTFSFLYFPTVQAPIFDADVFTLAGLTSPKVGTQLITSNDIFNYDIGDQFHYDTVYSNHGGARLEKRICTVLEKRISSNTDTVIYKIARAAEIQNLGSQTTTYNQKDTVIEKHILNEPVYYPEQAIPTVDPSLFLERNPFPQYKLIQNGDYNNRPLLSPSYYYPYYNGNCWQDIVPEFAPPSYSYGKGLGLVENDAIPSGDGSGSIDQQYIRLVYYKKGSETWGTPLVLSTYAKLNNTTASLFPNPLKQGEQLYLTTDHFTPVQTTVYNSTGNKVLELITNQIPIESIDVSMLQAGLYIIQLINEKNEYATSKLLIK